MKSQVREEKMIWKVFKLTWCFDKFRQIRKDVFANAKIRYNFSNCHMKISLQPL